jgi:hypothetical protein
VREPLVFGSTRYRTVLLPLPDAPDVMVIHDALLAAVHAQALVVETPTSPVSPSAGAPALGAEIEYEHETGGGDGGGGEGGGGDGGVGGLLLAACVTVNARPAIDSVPVRASPVLASTLNATEPSPVPVAPAVTVIHEALLVEAH